MNVPTTVFTPLEYSCCGYSEEDAFLKFGGDTLEVFHTNLWPLEWTVAEKDNNICYAKLICNKEDEVRFQPWVEFAMWWGWVKLVFHFNRIVAKR